MYGQAHPFALALLRRALDIFDTNKEQPQPLASWLVDAADYVSNSCFVSPALDLVAMERFEQIQKHGHTLEDDKSNNTRGQLKRAAMYCLTLQAEHWPNDWDDNVRENIYQKGQKERYIIAAALLVAEIDRFSFPNEEAGK